METFTVSVLLVDDTEADKRPDIVNPAFITRSAGTDFAVGLKTRYVWNHHRPVFGAPAITFQVGARNPAAAAEVAYEVTNSVVFTESQRDQFASKFGFRPDDELHCDRRYYDTVKSYREAKNRSMSMGDVVLVAGNEEDPQRFICARIGFIEF